jgi:ADP-ribosylglycohydrolase
LLGGAVGDALGAPVEFLSLAEIRAKFGASGIEELAPAYGRLGAVTDDTQMTLFTAEGLLRAEVRTQERGFADVSGVMHHALLRWLYTQGRRSRVLPHEPDGWLIQQEELFSLRAPGNTCLSALEGASRLGEVAQNDSKGCGAIMRVAPVGLVVQRLRGSGEAYRLAGESARSTHGHPTSTAASGFFALLIAELTQGRKLGEGVERGLLVLGREQGAEETVRAVRAALELAESDAPSTPETVERLGQGWVAEEALAIALFCALRAENFEHGLRLAVNHSGDSDSTGSLTGQLLGALLGDKVIPARWLAALELRAVIEALADDLAQMVESGRVDRAKYPGN